MSRKRGTAEGVTAELDNIPLVTVTLTKEACWITRHDRCGAPALTYPAAIGDVCNAFNRFGANTGLLPANTLFWSAQGGKQRIGIWLPPAKREIKLQVTRTVETLRVPLPGLMFVGESVNYSVYALKDRPATGREMLYQVPLPNVHQNGAICQGTVEFPKAQAGTMLTAVQLFFESLFNSDLSGGKIREGELLPFLRKLKRANQFPAGQMVPMNVTVGDLVSGERTQGAVITDGRWFQGGDDNEDFELDPYGYAYGETENDDDGDID